MLVLLVCYWFRLYYYFFVFFFKQKTAYEMRISDWSSDVCSSDLFGFNLVQLVVACRQDLIFSLSFLALFTQRFAQFRGGHAGNIVQLQASQIGRASCRERVCQYVEI